MTPLPAPGRNAPCPCGSGLRFKACCGRAAAVVQAAPVPGYPGWDRLPPPRQARLQNVLQQALAEQRSGRSQSAGALYQEVLAEAPDTFDALHMLGVIRYHERGFDEALRLVLRALDLSDWRDPSMLGNLRLIHDARAAAPGWIAGEPMPGSAGERAATGPVPAPAEPPPITAQGPWETGFFDIQPPAGEWWFNPGAIRLDGALHLSMRTMDRTSRRAGIVFIRLDREQRPVATTPLGYRPANAGEHVEDGRCLPIPGRDDRFLVAASNFVDWSKQHQVLFEVDRAFNVRAEFRIEFAGNAASIDGQRAMEKNWQFFHVGDRLHFVHWIRPHHVVCAVEGSRVVQTWQTRTRPPWRYGLASGGTPPVRIGDLYWSFFHSYRLDSAAQRRYCMGVYAFDAQPPFAVRCISRAPILTGTRAHPVALWEHLVVFPAGALYDAARDEWLLTIGVNDCRSAWMKIPHRELLDTVDWNDEAPR